MRIVRGVVVVSSLVMGLAAGLGEVAMVLDRAGAMPFGGGGESGSEYSPERWPLPFEDEAA